MNIRRCAFKFNHVLGTIERCLPSEVHGVTRELRNAIIKNDMYCTSPVFYTISGFNNETKEADYTFHVSLNCPINLKENDKFFYIDNLYFDDALMLRHADLDEDIETSYKVLKEAADKLGVELVEPFYNVYLDVYGEGIIDIYAPIKKGD